MSEVVAFVMKIILRRQFIFFFFLVQTLTMASDHEKTCVACRNAKALKAKKGDED